MSGTGGGGVGLRLRLVTSFVTVAGTTGVAALVLGALAFDRYRNRDVVAGAAGSVGELVRLLLVTVLGLGVLVSALALLAAGRVLRPLGRLAAAADRMARGDLDVRIPVRGDDEVARLTESFNEMARALSASVGDLRRHEEQARRFAADVSHELRTPLAAMTAVVDVLADEAGRLNANGAAAVGLVARETHHLSRLVDDLAEMSRFDAGSAALRLEDVDVGAAVHACLELRHWSDRVLVDVPAGLVARVDPRRLEVVLANLLGNALRHGEPPVTVSARLRRPEGAGAPPWGAAAWLRLVVADGGPGLPAHVLPHVFDRFFKADTARGRSEGSGLGLALAAENVRLHGGVIEAANAPDGGAVFTARLPLPAVS